MNTTKTIILMIGLTVLLVFVGGALAGRQGVIIAFMFAMVMNMFSYWFSDKIVLRMYNAQEVTEAEAPMLWAVTHDLALKMNMPMPKVYVIPSDAPNAFATGRNHRAHCDGDHCTHSRRPDPDGDFAVTRIRSRCDRGAHLRKPVMAGQCSAKASRRIAARTT